MKELEEIQEAVRKLPKDKLAKFRAWFWRFDAQVWDEELEKDVKEGKLDRLADEALRDLQKGYCTDL